MKFLLDTNVCIEVLRGRGTSISERLDAEGEGAAALCAPVRYELLKGALVSRQRDQNLSRVRAFLSRMVSVPFDDRAADHAAEIDASLTASGRQIGFNDILIAATALANRLTLVTHNIDEFSRVPGLQVEDWQRGPSPP